MKIPILYVYASILTLIAVANGLPNLGVDLLQVFYALPSYTSMSTLQVPDVSWWYDFRREVKKLGQQAIDYTNKELNDAARKYPEVSAKIEEFRSSMAQLVNSTDVLHQGQDAFSIRGFDMEEFTQKISQEVELELEKLKEEFKEPLPEDQTERYKQREYAVSRALDRTEGALVRVYRMFNVPEFEVREKFGNVRPHLKRSVLIVGNIADKHPELVELLIFTAVVIVPETWILKPILRLVGFGPSGPVKGSSAAWAQRFFFRTAIKEGSWFSRLQRAGMKEPSWFEKVKLFIRRLRGLWVRWLRFIN